MNKDIKKRLMELESILRQKKTSKDLNKDCDFTDIYQAAEYNSLKVAEKAEELKQIKQFKNDAKKRPEQLKNLTTTLFCLGRVMKAYNHGYAMVNAYDAVNYDAPPVNVIIAKRIAFAYVLNSFVYGKKFVEKELSPFIMENALYAVPLSKNPRYAQNLLWFNKEMVFNNNKIVFKDYEDDALKKIKELDEVIEKDNKALSRLMKDLR